MIIGVDSCAQHIAYAMDKPGTVIMGGTVERNYTYPQHFSVIRKEGSQPIYNPIRLGHGDGEFVNRLNEDTMNFDERDISEIIQFIRAQL